MINISVKALDGTNKSFNVDEEISISAFKKHIANGIGIVANQQKIIYQGRVLTDAKLLKEYNLDGKVLHVVSSNSRPHTNESRSTNQTGAQMGQARRLHIPSVDVHINVSSPVQLTMPMPNQMNPSRFDQANRMLDKIHIILNDMEKKDSQNSAPNGPSTSASPEPGSPVRNNPGPPAAAHVNPTLTVSSCNLGDLLERVTSMSDRLRPFSLRFRDLLRESTQLPTQEDKNNFKQFREVMHLLSHVQHILTDFNINFDDPVPRIASIPSGMRNHSITSDPGGQTIFTAHRAIINEPSDQDLNNHISEHLAGIMSPINGVLQQITGQNNNDLQSIRQFFVVGANGIAEEVRLGANGAPASTATPSRGANGTNPRATPRSTTTPTPMLSPRSAGVTDHQLYLSALEAAAQMDTEAAGASETPANPDAEGPAMRPVPPAYRPPPPARSDNNSNNSSSHDAVEADSTTARERALIRRERAEMSVLATALANMRRSLPSNARSQRGLRQAAATAIIVTRNTDGTDGEVISSGSNRPTRPRSSSRPRNATPTDSRPVATPTASATASLAPTHEFHTHRYLDPFLPCHSTLFMLENTSFNRNASSNTPTPAPHVPTTASVVAALNPTANIVPIPATTSQVTDPATNNSSGDTQSASSTDSQSAFAAVQDIANASNGSVLTDPFIQGLNLFQQPLLRWIEENQFQSHAEGADRVKVMCEDICNDAKPFFQTICETISQKDGYNLGESMLNYFKAGLPSVITPLLSSERPNLGRVTFPDLIVGLLTNAVNHMAAVNLACVQVPLALQDMAQLITQQFLGIYRGNTGCLHATVVRGLVVNMLDLHVARALNVDLYIHIETSTKTELPTETDADTREQAMAQLNSLVKCRQRIGGDGGPLVERRFQVEPIPADPPILYEMLDQSCGGQSPSDEWHMQVPQVSYEAQRTLLKTRRNRLPTPLLVKKSEVDESSPRPDCELNISWVETIQNDDRLGMRLRSDQPTSEAYDSGKPDFKKRKVDGEE